MNPLPEPFISHYSYLSSEIYTSKIILCLTSKCWFHKLKSEEILSQRLTPPVTAWFLFYKILYKQWRFYGDHGAMPQSAPPPPPPDADELFLENYFIMVLINTIRHGSNQNLVDMLSRWYLYFFCFCLSLYKLHSCVFTKAISRGDYYFMILR